MQLGGTYNSALIAGGQLDAMAGGHGAIRSVLGMLERSFPDLQIEVEILLEGEGPSRSSRPEYG
jgi:hypothetical protein